MDSNWERNFLDAPLTGDPGYMDGSGLVVDYLGHPSLCARCRRSLAPEYEATYDIEPFGLCGDCKNSHHRRTTRRRRNRQSSFASMEKLFSRHFSHMNGLAMHNQSTLSGLDNAIRDGGSTARSIQQSSSSATPSGSDSESDGFDNLDSVFGDSESDVSTYEGDSDASVDGDISSDTEDEGDEDGEWEEGEDYEEGKQHMNNEMKTHEIQLQDASKDGSSDEAEAEAEESCQLSPRRSQEVPHLDPTISSSAREGSIDWLFHAAGIVGVVLMLWLGKPTIGRGRRGSTSHCDLHS